MVEPVVVYPETLSNHAFINVNSPPQSTYGSIPNMKDRSHERTMVRKPSFRDSAWDFLTKMKGNPPAIRVIMKLIIRGPNAESRPSITETMMDRNMNRALTRSALPTFTDIAFTFIVRLLLIVRHVLFPFFPKHLYPLPEFDIFFCQFGYAGIYICKLIVSVKLICMSAA